MIQKIQKFLSNCGYGSRRSIEKMIKCGLISINGKQVILGQYVDENNPGEIQIKKKILSLKKIQLKCRVLIYNKPEGEICTRSDSQKRKTVFDNLPILNMNRWMSVGRLDINTRGLLLFTNDGNLCNQLMHPSNRIEREYYMRIFGKINANTMNILTNGVNIKGNYVSFQEITPFSKKMSGKNQWFKGVLCEGKNREIRLMWKTIKCQVSRLIRIRYGNIILPKNLKLGQWMELNSESLNDLFSLIAIKNTPIKN